jgi:hypothetical protein
LNDLIINADFDSVLVNNPFFGIELCDIEFVLMGKQALYLLRRGLACKVSLI